MRVLHLYKDSYPPVIGGIERQIRSIRQALPEMRHDVLVCARGRRTRVMRDPAGSVGTDTLVGEFGRILSTPIAPAYPRWARRLAPGAVIHLHMPNPLAEASLLMLPSSSPVVVTYHADIYRQRHLLPLYRPLIRRCLRRAQVVVTSSARLREGSPLLRDARAITRVVPFAIDVDWWRPEAADGRVVDDLLAAHEGPFVLAVGRLVAYKGFDRLVEAATELPWNVAIVGEGPLRADLERQIRDLGLQDRVHLAGRVDDERLRAYFTAAGLFVLPSLNRAEAFGVVLLEAQAAGLPVVVTDTGAGSPEAFEPGGSGTLIPPGDREALTAAILDLIGDSARRARFAAAGQARVRERNSLEALAGGLEPIYRELADA